MPQSKRQKQEAALARLYQQLAKITNDIGMYSNKLKFRGVREQMVLHLEAERRVVVQRIKALAVKLGVETKVI